MSSETRM